MKLKEIYRDIFFSILIGIALYILSLLFSSIAFMNVNSCLYVMLFCSFLLLGCFVLVFGLQYRCKHIPRKISRFLFTVFFYVCFFLLGAYSGVARWYYGLFDFSQFDSNNNVSGLLFVTFLSIILVIGLLTLLLCSFWRIVKRKKTD